MSAPSPTPSEFDKWWLGERGYGLNFPEMRFVAKAAWDAAAPSEKPRLQTGYAPDCDDCPTPAECKAANDCAVMRQVRHPVQASGDKQRDELVETLRTADLREFGARKGNMGLDETSKLFGAAADEIDRLRAQLAGGVSASGRRNEIIEECAIACEKRQRYLSDDMPDIREGVRAEEDALRHAAKRVRALKDKPSDRQTTK